ncbi:MAG: hypothetical protein R2867_14335 [Caldilineaceae bacterium]
MVRFYDKKRKIRWKWCYIDGKNCPWHHWVVLIQDATPQIGKRGSKLHILVDKTCAADSFGFGCQLIAIINERSRSCLFPVVKRPDSEQHFRQIAYDSADIRLSNTISRISNADEDVANHRVTSSVPGETQYPARRWVVERTFGWLAKRRSIRTRWCKKPANWLAFLQFACAHVTYQMAFSG